MSKNNIGQRGKAKKPYVDESRMSKFEKLRINIDRRIVLMNLIRMQFIIEAVLILIANVIIIKDHFIVSSDYTTLRLMIIMIIYYKMVDLLIVKFGNNVPWLSASIISRLTILASLTATFIISLI